MEEDNMEDSPRTLDDWVQKERTKYCPMNFCIESCPIKGERCEIEKILKHEHKTNVDIFDVKVRW